MGIVYQNALLGLRLKVTAGGNIAERLLMAGWRRVDLMRARAADLLAPHRGAGRAHGRAAAQFFRRDAAAGADRQGALDLPGPAASWTR
jgi:hypothetical protein